MDDKFGEILTKARKAVKLTQTEAAEKADVTLRTWQRYEAGDVPSNKKLKIIDNILGTTFAATQKEKPQIVANDALGVILSKVVKADAMQEVLLEAIAELLAHNLNSPVTSVLDGLKKAVENRTAVKSDQLQRKE